MGTKEPRNANTKTAAEKPERKMSRSALMELYATRRYLGLDTLTQMGLRMPVEVYFKDPATAKDLFQCHQLSVWANVQTRIRRIH